MVIENSTIVVKFGEANYVGDIIVPIVVARIVAAVSILIFWYQRKTARHTAVAEAFKMLNDVKHREARKVLYDIDEKRPPREASYDIIGIDSNKPSNQEALVEICKDIVKNDFNEIGTLIHYRLLDGKIFINENFWIILKIWSLVHEDIKDRRKRHSFNYMQRLEELKEKACKYAEKNHPDTHKQFCSDKVTNANDTKTEGTQQEQSNAKTLKTF